MLNNDLVKKKNDLSKSLVKEYKNISNSFLKIAHLNEQLMTLENQIERNTHSSHIRMTENLLNYDKSSEEDKTSTANNTNINNNITNFPGAIENTIKEELSDDQMTNSITSNNNNIEQPPSKGLKLNKKSKNCANGIYHVNLSKFDKGPDCPKGYKARLHFGGEEFRLGPFGTIEEAKKVKEMFNNKRKEVKINEMNKEKREAFINQFRDEIYNVYHPKLVYP
jgi:hypothetical protein